MLVPNTSNIVPTASLKTAHQNAPLDALRAKQAEQGRGDSDELREAFDNFVGQTFFSQMLASMRSTQQESAYFHGGQAERIFQGQLDQILTEELSKSSASQITEPMFELFQLRRAG